MSLSLDIYSSAGFFQKRLPISFPNVNKAFIPQEQIDIIKQVLINNPTLQKIQKERGYLLLLDITRKNQTNNLGYEVYFNNNKIYFKKFTKVESDTVWNGTLNKHNIAE